MALDRKAQLAAMKMPKKPMAAEEADMDLDQIDLGEDEAPEQDPGAKASPLMGEDAAPGQDMSELSDDDLIAEMKARGLLEEENEPGEEPEQILKGTGKPMPPMKK